MSRATLLFLAVVFLATDAFAQTSYRLKGTVKDEKGAAVSGARIRAEALSGFRGEQFVGQKEFAVTSNDKGEWTILGLTSGIWTFEATAPGLAPNVIVLPVQYTQRKMQSATGGQLAWDLPMTLVRSSNAMLQRASEAAAAGRADEAVSLAGGLAEEKDLDAVCGGGQVALLLRQDGLAGALFRQAAKLDPKSSCASLGLSSTALMRGDVIGRCKVALGRARSGAAEPASRACRRLHRPPAGVRFQVSASNLRSPAAGSVCAHSPGRGIQARGAAPAVRMAKMLGVARSDPARSGLKQRINFQATAQICETPTGCWRGRRPI